MTATIPRHDAKYSGEVVAMIHEILHSKSAPVQGPIFDPFAGLGLDLPKLRHDATGIEIEPDWANASPLITQGDALNPNDYPPTIGAIATSPCYGNRMADQYLGAPCPNCNGTGQTFDRAALSEDLFPIDCPTCNRTGRDPEDQKRRYGYALSLGHPTHPNSAASLHFHNNHKGHRYRAFHAKWLRLIAHQILKPGPRRLILNMKDHYRTEQTQDGINAQRRQYACDWWLHAAHESGLRLTAALPVYTAGYGYGANMATGKAEHEMIFVFDLLRSA